MPVPITIMLSLTELDPELTSIHLSPFLLCFYQSYQQYISIIFHMPLSHRSLYLFFLYKDYDKNQEFKYVTFRFLPLQLHVFATTSSGTSVSVIFIA